MMGRAAWEPSSPYTVQLEPGVALPSLLGSVAGLNARQQLPGARGTCVVTTQPVLAADMTSRHARAALEQSLPRMLHPEADVVMMCHFPFSPKMTGSMFNFYQGCTGMGHT